MLYFDADCVDTVGDADTEAEVPQRSEALGDDTESRLEVPSCLEALAIGFEIEEVRRLRGGGVTGRVAFDAILFIDDAVSMVGEYA